MNYNKLEQCLHLIVDQISDLDKCADNFKDNADKAIVNAHTREIGKVLYYINDFLRGESIEETAHKLFEMDE